MEVFDQRFHEQVRVLGVPHDDGNAVEAGPAGRPEASLPGDDLVGAGFGRAHHDRLHHADLPNRGGELVEAEIFELPARLTRIGSQRRQRDGQQPVLARLCRWDERPQATTQPRRAVHGPTPVVTGAMRCRTCWASAR